MTLRDLMTALRDTYTGSIGAEFMHIAIQSKSVGCSNAWKAAAGAPVFLLIKKANPDRVTAAEGLERYLHTKYVGQKRFSLEGGESFIAAMDEVIQRAGSKGVQEIVIGMAHRGRLNVLVNTLGKMPGDLFAEFEGKHADDLPSGDVKYHKGFSNT
jgi:2-oxoglutarate dehydrogenase E1 component